MKTKLYVISLLIIFFVPTTISLAQEGETEEIEKVTEEEIQKMREKLGYSKPQPIRDKVEEFFSQFLQGDFGTSLNLQKVVIASILLLILVTA